MYKVIHLLTKLIVLVLTAWTFAACSTSTDNPPDISGSRNQWDGRYRLAGTMYDSVNSDFRWHSDTFEYSLHTSGTHTDSLVSDLLGFPGIVIGNLINTTYYSKFGLVLTMDATSNKVTGVTNYYGQPSSSGRSAVLDPTGVNSIDPITKNIRVKFFMDEVGRVGHRASFDLTLVYLGSRPK